MDDNNILEASQNQTPASDDAKPKSSTCKHVPIIIVLVLLLVCTSALAVVEYVMMQRDKKPIAEQTTTEEEEPAPSVPGGKVSPIPEQPVKPDEEEKGTKSVSINITIHAKHGFRVISKGTPENQYLDSAGYASLILDDDFYVHDEKDIIFSRYNEHFSGISPSENIAQEFSFDGEVTRAMVGLFGNGGYEAILLQFSDGTVGAIYLDYKDMTFKSIPRLSGVGGVTALYEGYEDNGSEVFAINANGEALSLYNKIWKD